MSCRTITMAEGRNILPILCIFSFIFGTAEAAVQHNTALIDVQYDSEPIAVQKPQNFVIAQSYNGTNNSKFFPKSSRYAEIDENGDNLNFYAGPDLGFYSRKKQSAEARLVDYSTERYVESTSFTVSISNPSDDKFFGENITLDTNKEIPKNKNTEHEEHSAGMLIGKLNVVETSNTLPIFLIEPENSFVLKNRPAVLKCKAAHALQLQFKCSGSSQPPPSTHDKHVDPHTGVHLEEVTATIHRDLVDEYFGKGHFKCECHAWSSRGVAKSTPATISIAYIRKHFVTSPTSLRIELGSRAELHCRPPSGYPEPKITWYKNDVPFAALTDHAVVVSGDGSLTFAHVSLQDMANYTCHADNIAGKRTSNSAVLIVYVNGGWSSWSPWKDCKCPNKPNQGRKRSRSCTNPIPLNGGSECSGPLIQKSADCIPCPEDTQIIHSESLDAPSNKRFGRWSVWSGWSACNADCIQIRRRKCVINAGDDTSTTVTIVNDFNTEPVSESLYSKLQCSGKDLQTAECRGGDCLISKDDFDWAFYLGLAFTIAVFIGVGSFVICIGRRNITATGGYNMTRTVMASEYIQGVNKKDVGMGIEAVNVNYDYPAADQRFISSDCIISTGNESEHHYDVPNLSAHYTNPIDELSADYISETPDTSSGDTSHSIYDSKNACLNTSHNATWEMFNSSGGYVSLYGVEVMLFIPEFAIGKHPKHVSLVLLGDDSSHNSFPCTEPLLVCSVIVNCGPRNYSFLKPVVLKIPHCLNYPEDWNVNVYLADNDASDINVSWRKIICVGEETINTPVFVQLESTHIYIMTEKLGRFVVIADPRSNVATSKWLSIKMKLIAFSQLAPSSKNFSLRIYVVKDFPDSKNICTSIEKKLGGTFVGESDSFAFHLNNCDLNIRVYGANNCREQAEEIELEHVIPYNHILSNNSVMHCEFSIKQNAVQSNAALSLDVSFTQCSNGTSALASATENQLHSFQISSNDSCSANSKLLVAELQTAVSVPKDKLGSYVNEINMLSTVQLHRTTKRLLCAALDPPRADERDWRLLSKKLNTDHYIAYFATKPSPTEQILNLWECRACGTSQTIVDLLMVLSDMDRQDVIDIISNTMGPLWV